MRTDTIIISKSNDKTETFDIVAYGTNFKLDIVETCADYEAYIYAPAYSIKELMFGCPKEQQTKAEYMDIVAGNLINGNEYILNYMEEYMN